MMLDAVTVKNKTHTMISMKGDDAFLRCCIANNSRISFCYHNIRNSNPYHYIFVLEIFPVLKMLANLLSHHFTSNRAVMAFCSKEESQNNLSEMSGG